MSPARWTRRRDTALVATGALVLLACLLAEPVPSTLAELHGQAGAQGQHFLP